MYIYIIIHTSACRGAAPATTYARLGNRDQVETGVLTHYRHTQSYWRALLATGSATVILWCLKRLFLRRRPSDVKENKVIKKEKCSNANMLYARVTFYCYTALTFTSPEIRFWSILSEKRWWKRLKTQKWALSHSIREFRFYYCICVGLLHPPRTDLIYIS